MTTWIGNAQEGYQRGMEASELAARYRWTPLDILAVDAAIGIVAGRGQTFTADAIWTQLGEGFPVTKGLAGRLKAAIHAQVIRPTGQVTFSQRQGEHGHGQRLAIWAPGPRAPRPAPPLTETEQRSLWGDR